MVRLVQGIGGIFGIILLLLSGGITLARQTHTTPAWIIYLQLENNASQLYRMWWDGSHAERLTHQPMQHFAARWSPDNRQIAFLSSENGTQLRLEIMTPQGRQRRPLTSTVQRLVILGVWSQDARWLLAESQRQGSFEVYRIAPDIMQNVSLNPAYDGAPHWSPDSQWIVFESSRNDNLDLYRVPVMGSRTPEQLTDQPYDEGHPVWSPDGQWIAYIARAGSNRDIYIMRPDGSETRPITWNHLDYQWVAWSPDSQQLIYLASDRRLFTSRLDDPATRILAESVRSIEANSWSPDGRWLVIERFHTLYRLDPRTGAIVPLKRDVPVCCASWSPVQELPWRYQGVLAISAIMLLSVTMITRRLGRGLLKS